MPTAQQKQTAQKPTAQKQTNRILNVDCPLDIDALVRSAHAAERQDERCLPDWQVEFALRWGTCLRRRGATFYHVRREDLPAWLCERHARRFYGTTLVVADGVLVTAYRKPGGFRKLLRSGRCRGH